MGIDRLKAFIDENLSGKRLIIVSSREPYVHKKSAAGIKVDSPAGGLTSALDDVMRAIGGKWVAWGSGNADRTVAVDDRVAVPPERPSYTLRRVWLSPGEVNNYYHGYSNHVLWPLCHITLNRVFFLKRFWEDYLRVNEKFADAAAGEADEKSIVWVHDYHMCLVPKLLRQRKPGLTIVHFWHIPWPDWGVFRVCPQAREILEGLLANDLIGFQIPLFVKNFIDCVKESLDADINYSNSTVTYKGHTTRLKAFPISIDYDKFHSAASSKRTESTIEKIRQRFKSGELLGLGVDRLEYTKALIKRLQAIELFFEKYPEYRSRVTFVQIAVPTRMKEPYISYKEAVEEMISKVNDRYSTSDWRPIVYLDKKADYKDLVVYYRLADVAVVSSIYDGMNLVAKEYIASQVDENGALILSELAGAADELEGALLINPYDVEDFAEKIKLALEMPPRDKKALMGALKKQVRDYDIYRWISEILKEISRISYMKEKKCMYLFDNVEELKKRLEARNVFLFIDYDGTLTPIVPTPEEAFISEEMLSLLKGLKELLPVAVISGRGLKDVKDRVGIEDIIYAGNHGAEIWDGEKTAVSQNLTVNRERLEEVLERLRKALSHIQGVLIEDKGPTASIHFRQIRPRDLAEFFDLFSKAVEGTEDVFRITSGKKVFEIRPLDIWNKGDAVSWINKNLFEGRDPIYIGDDTTDEDAYRAIKGRGVSVSIGISTESDYYLKSQSEVKRFLETLRDLLEKA